VFKFKSYFVIEVFIILISSLSVSMSNEAANPYKKISRKVTLGIVAGVFLKERDKKFKSFLKK